MWLYIMLLIGGLFLLIKGADIFVDASVKVARIFKISELLIGMTLVCFGTSLPELFVSINGSIKGTSDLVIGNMLGSSIFNICVILGLVAVIHPVRLLKDTVRKDMYMSLVTGALFLLLIIDTVGTTLTGNIISRTDAGVLLLTFVIFMYYNLYHFETFAMKTRKKKVLKKKQKQEGETQNVKTKVNSTQKRNIIENILLCILGIGLIYVGSELVLNGAVGFAINLGVSETFVAILVLAVGTSLPEVATSISAIKKKKINVAIGNLIGSNMYNLLFIVGTAALINPLQVLTTEIFVDAIVFIFIAILLIVFSKVRYIKKGYYEISRAEGITLLVIYVAYATYVIMRG